MSEEKRPCQGGKDNGQNPKWKSRSGAIVKFNPVNLVFAKLEKVCDLTFSDELRPCIQVAADGYRHLTSLDAKAPPTTKVRAALNHITKACNRLIPMLEAYAGRTDSPEAEAVRIAYPSNEYASWIEEGVLAAFLMDIAQQAREAAAEKVKQGRPREQEQERLITAVYKVFRKAGGRGRGCTTDGTTGSGYSGPFYNLVAEIILQTDGIVMNPSGIGKAIVKLIPGK
jgi:hypothetical protein